MTMRCDARRSNERYGRMKRIALASLAGAMVLVPGIGLAQEAAEAALPTVETLGAEMTFVFNSLLFLIGGILVFWMAAGFAMLEAGFVRSKNVTVQLTKNVGLFSIAAFLYYLIGFNLMYPGDGWLVEGWLGAFGTTVLEPVGVTAEGVADLGYASVGSDFFFQVMFCATAASIVSG